MIHNGCTSPICEGYMLLLNGATVCMMKAVCLRGCLAGGKASARGICMEKARRNILRASCRHEIYEKADG